MNFIIKIQFIVNKYEENNKLTNIKLMYINMYCLDLSIFLRSMLLNELSETKILLVYFIINIFYQICEYHLLVEILKYMLNGID